MNAEQWPIAAGLAIAAAMMLLERQFNRHAFDGPGRAMGLLRRVLVALFAILTIALCTATLALPWFLFPFVRLRFTKVTLDRAPETYLPDDVLLRTMDGTVLWRRGAT